MVIFSKEPKTIRKLIPFSSVYSETAMEIAINIAIESAKLGMGPFGAVITNPTGKILSYGYNNVTKTCDSTAHAEINAIREAQRKKGTFNLEPFDLILYSSSEPCIQCFGAIYWSGIKRVYSAATKEDVEKIGFKEGPVDKKLWEMAKKEKGIQFVPGFFRGKTALIPFEIYKNKKGLIY